MKILNLYAGVGGNRKFWNGYSITAIEKNEKIANVYKKLYPTDTVIITDAHNYLLEHYNEFDFIWSSPPCQSHSRMMKGTRHKANKYPDFTLYQEIVFLQNFYQGKWIVENVIPYYKPLIEPTQKIGRHLFWSNFNFAEIDIDKPKGFINTTNMVGRKNLQDWLGIHFDDIIYYENNHCPAQVLRNCVHPDLGKHIFESLFQTGSLELKTGLTIEAHQNGN